MKFVQAVKSYKGAVEGWTTRGTIFNVGKEHKPGLRTMTEQRAKQVLHAGLCIEYVEGDAQLKAAPNDPVVLKDDALRQRAREASMASRAQQRQDSRRRTKVDPPPSNKTPPPAKNPPPPRRAADVPRPSQAALTKEKSTAGGQTGAAQDSSSSSPADPPAAESTGKRRGIRRGDSEHRKRLRGGSRSTKAGDSSETPTRSTAPTSTGGSNAKASPDSPA